MDYGKLAYLKAVDLEDKLSLTKKAGFSVSTAQFSLPKGLSYLTDVQGNGDIAVFASAPHEVVFYVDGVRICQGDKVFFKLNDGGKITVQSEQELDKVSLMIMGDVTQAEQTGTSNFDYNGSTVAYVIGEQAKISAYAFDQAEFEPAKIYEGAFAHGDICAFGGGFAMAFTDGVGVVKMLTTDGREREYSLVADRVAINSDGFELTVAYVTRGELFYFELGDFGEPISAVNKVAYNGYVDDVKFVKKGRKLLFSSGGRCFVKELGAKGENKDRLYVNLIAEVL